MSWDRLVQMFDSTNDRLLRIFRKTMEEIRTASWVEIPVLSILLVLFMPSIVLLAWVRLLIKKPGGR